MTAPPMTRAGRGGRASAAVPDRLPAPVRERRPALAALAVLLIVGGALVAGLFVMRTGDRQDYLVLRHEVMPGQLVSADDFGIARLAGDGASAIPASARARIAGRYATTHLYGGQLATSRMFTTEPPIPADASVVGISVPANQRPAAALATGDVIALYVLGGDTGGVPTTPLLPAVRVVDVPSERSDSDVVSVLVPTASAGPVAAYAATNRLAVAVLRPGTTPVIDFAGATDVSAPGASPSGAAPSASGSAAASPTAAASGSAAP